MLAVDLSRAFDMVSHHDLFHSMVAAGIPQPITQVILALHNNISYHLRVSQHTASVQVRRGVRQGCIIAPHLCNLITSAILQTLSQVLPTEWITRLMTLFADDTLCKWHIRSISDLEFTESSVIHLLDVFRAFALKVNERKSQLLLDVRGRLGKLWVKKRLVNTPDGPAIRLRARGQEVIVPKSRGIKYLGAYLSFGHFEDITARDRMKQGEVQRHRLTRFLQGMPSHNMDELPCGGRVCRPLPRTHFP